MQDYDDFGGTLNEAEWQDFENESMDSLDSYVCEGEANEGSPLTEVNYIIYVTACARKKFTNGGLITLHSYIDCPGLNASYDGMPNSGAAAINFTSIDRRKDYLNSIGCTWKCCLLCEKRYAEETTVQACEDFLATRKEEQQMLSELEDEDKILQTEIDDYIEELKKADQEAIAEWDELSAAASPPLSSTNTHPAK